MTGLDTNVLVCYLTRDDPEPYRVTKALIESTCTQENPGVIGPVLRFPVLRHMPCPHPMANAGMRQRRGR